MEKVYILFVLVVSLFFSTINAYSTKTLLNNSNLTPNSAFACQGDFCYIVFGNSDGTISINQYLVSSMFNSTDTVLEPVAFIGLGAKPFNSLVKQFNIQGSPSTVILGYGNYYYQADFSTGDYVQLASTFPPSNGDSIPSLTIGNGFAFINNSPSVVRASPLTNGIIPSGYTGTEPILQNNPSLTSPIIYDSVNNYLYFLTLTSIIRTNTDFSQPLTYPRSAPNYPQQSGTLANDNTRLYFIQNVNNRAVVTGVDTNNLYPFQANISVTSTQYVTLKLGYLSVYDYLQDIVIFIYDSQGLQHLMLIDTLSGKSKEIINLPQLDGNLGATITWAYNKNDYTADSMVIYTSSQNLVVTVPYKNFCPQACNNNGVCRKLVCTCKSGTFGNACENVVPVVNSVKSIPIASSELITIFGSGFVNPVIEFDGEEITIQSFNDTFIEFSLIDFSIFNPNNLYGITVYLGADVNKEYPVYDNTFGFILPTVDSYVQDGLYVNVFFTNLPELAIPTVVVSPSNAVVLLSVNTSMAVLKPRLSLSQLSFTLSCSSVCYFATTYPNPFVLPLIPTITGPSTIPPESQTITLNFAFTPNTVQLNVQQVDNDPQTLTVTNSIANFLVAPTILESSYFIVYDANGNYSNRYYTAYYQPAILSNTQSSDGSSLEIIAINTGNDLNFISVFFNNNTETPGVIQSIENTGTPLSNKINVTIPFTAISGLFSLYVDTQSTSENCTIVPKLNTVTKPSINGGNIVITGYYMSGDVEIIPYGSSILKYTSQCTTTDPENYICPVKNGSGKFDILFSTENEPYYNTSYQEPTITQITPDSVLINSSTTLELTGSNFANVDMIITIGNDSCLVITESITDTSVQCNYTSPSKNPNFTKLDVSITVDTLVGSKTNFFGLQLLCPIGLKNIECSDKGTCKRTTGICECSKGYKGDSCNVPPPTSPPSNSSEDISSTTRLSFSLYFTLIILISTITI